MTRRRMISFLAAAVLISGCGGDDESAAPSAETTTSTGPTTTTIDIRSRQVPEKPDVAYVEAVMKHLSGIRSDVRRDVFSTQSMSPATYDRLADIYNGKQLDSANKTWSKESMEAHPDALPIPGDDRWLNYEILDSRADCIVFTAESDNSAIMKTATVPFPKLVFEIRTFEGDHRTNRTPWKITVENKYRDEFRVGYTCDS